MSNFLEKFSPTVADVSRGQFGAAVPGVVGAVAGYATWRQIYPTRTWLRHRVMTHKVPAIGALTGMVMGEVSQELYRGGNAAREAVVGALGIIGAILLPKYVMKYVPLPKSTIVSGALRHVAYPATGFLAGKAIGSAVWRQP